MFFFAEQINPFKTQLNKDLFYADFSHFKNYGNSISGCRYAAIPKGPVPDRYSSLFEKRVEDKYIRIETKYFYGYEGEKFFLLKEFSMDVFTESELQTLYAVSSFLKNKTTKQIVDLSHEQNGWVENVKSCTLIDYKYAIDLKLF